MSLPFLVLLPALGAILVALLPRGRRALAEGVSALVSLATLGLALSLYPGAAAGGTIGESGPGILLGILGIRRPLLALDGVSLPLVILTPLLTLLATVAARDTIRRRPRGHQACLLLLEAATIGVFLARDLLLFYVFFEAMLVPMTILIGVWGSRERIRAAVKFLVFTLAGSLPLLLAVVAIASRTEGPLDLSFASVREAAGRFSPSGRLALFAAFAWAFAVKVPLVPLHTWLPDAHVEAPAGGSVLLAGLLLKVGAYGLLRVAAPLFPEEMALASGTIGWIAAAGVAYGAMMAYVQEDMKRLVAFSSVSHMGLVVLGICAAARLDEGGPRALAAAGSVLQMASHGVNTGGLFLVVGFLYDRFHTRHLDDYGGLASRMPRLAVALVLLALGSVGLPGTNGFVGEFLILQGVFAASPAWAVLGALGAVLGAAYMLRLLERVLFGEPPGTLDPAPDLRPREVACLAPLLAAVVLLGLRPGLLLDPIRRGLDRPAVAAKGAP